MGDTPAVMQEQSNLAQGGSGDEESGENAEEVNAVNDMVRLFVCLCV